MTGDDPEITLNPQSWRNRFQLPQSRQNQIPADFIQALWETFQAITTGYEQIPERGSAGCINLLQTRKTKQFHVEVFARWQWQGFEIGRINQTKVLETLHTSGERISRNAHKVYMRGATESPRKLLEF